MNNIFSFRMDEETSHKLQMLADRTVRSRGNVIRLLIRNASPHNGMISTDLSNPNNTPPKIESEDSGVEKGVEVR